MLVLFEKSKMDEDEVLVNAYSYVSCKVNKQYGSYVYFSKNINRLNQVGT